MNEWVPRYMIIIRLSRLAGKSIFPKTTLNLTIMHFFDKKLSSCAGKVQSKNRQNREKMALASLRLLRYNPLIDVQL